MTFSAVKRKRSGFTLIELLVVIAIIAILAAILFPVFAKAREKARQTSCLSQTKQLGLAFIQYYQDYDEKLPAGTAGIAPAQPTAPSATDPGTAGQGWANQIYNQVKSVGIYKCPDDSTTANGTNNLQVPISYAFNANAAGQTQATYGNVAKSILLCEISGDTSDVTAPNATDNGTATGSVATTGAGTTNMFSTGTATFGTTSATLATGTLNGGPVQTPATGRHSDGSNFLLADGHSKWFRGAAVAPGLNNNVGGSDCGMIGSFNPSGTTSTAAAGTAAASGCSSSVLGATFSVN